jgi:hypothetical protein
MKKSMTALQIAGFLAVLTLGGACVGVRVRQGVHDADAYFEQARRDIRAIEAENPGRRGHVHQVCVLVHDRHSSELVEVTTPLWLANACLDLGLSAAEHDRDYGLHERYGVNLKALKDLKRLGPGLLVEINDEDTQVLVWLR